METLRQWIEEGWWVYMGFEIEDGNRVYWCEIADGTFVKEGEGKTLDSAITNAIEKSPREEAF
ncbi:MAG: hypothetical protein ACYDBP_11605 [Leptospirales bacterium]